METFDSFWLSWQLLVLMLTLVIIFLYRHFTQLKRLGIPGPAPLPIIGNLPERLQYGIDKIDEKYLQKYGKVFGYYRGYRPIITITDPEILKSVLIKDFQNFTDRPNFGTIPKLMADGVFFMKRRRWKRTRNIITPTFSAGKLKNLLPIINRCAETLVSNLQDKAGETVAVVKYFNHFTIDAIASTAFGIDIDSQKRPDDPFVKNLEPIFSISKWALVPILLTSIIPGIGRLLYRLGLTIWPLKSITFYEETAKALIHGRRRDLDSATKIDFLQMLINAEIDETKAEYIHNESTFSKTVTNDNQTPQTGKLSDDEVAGQVFVFFLAGYETTASLLRYAAYILALHPDIDDKLCEEIESQIGEETPTYENVGNLKYMDQFINEVLRFYPPVPRLSREAKETITVCGLTIPKGAIVEVPVWSIHHSSDNYPDPETFDPERFSQKKAGNIEGVTFLPFGAGPRNCIGMRLALVEAKIALVYMLRKIRFVKSDKTKVPLDLNHAVILRPRIPVELRIEHR